ncbi:nucleotidyl transferase AbiEii/AbiGii toxin family protein [Achromobacter anxifer]|uniref:Nucleotidyl transferase AbiEii/AbiGii toxin family protein n=1 Tax=Achromobacter anxifer TaxID=1287737 RepID=A0A6S7CZH2_9BURK|nr:hypothetical protein LMG26858_02622 [Achromobacter anxifer]
MTVARNIAASLRARLLNKARADRQDFSLLLSRYALERILYRLSISIYREQFLLKGSLLFDLWFDMPHRPTHDADLLGFTLAEVPHLITVFQQISAIACEDGMIYPADSVRAAAIRKEANYAGIRVNLVGSLDGARCPVQIDIGFGDAVVPGPEGEVSRHLRRNACTVPACLSSVRRHCGKAGSHRLARHGQHADERLFRFVGTGAASGNRWRNSGSCSACNVYAQSETDSSWEPFGISRRVRPRCKEGATVAGIPEQERAGAGAAGCGRWNHTPAIASCAEKQRRAWQVAYCGSPYFTVRNLNALKITEAELKLIASAAIIGDSSHPVKG